MEYLLSIRLFVTLLLAWSTDNLYMSCAVSKGMLPNRFPDDGSAPTEEDYNSADGTVRRLSEYIFVS